MLYVMISKEKVLRIVNKNNQIKANDNPDHEILKDWEWSEKKKNLCKEIENLPDDELVDLLALVAYGRELSQQGGKASYPAFIKVRTNVANNCTGEWRNGKATYLLKMHDLSLYLNVAKEVLNQAEFDF